MYNHLKSFAKKNHFIKQLYRRLVRADVVERKLMELEEKLIYKYIFDLEQRVSELEKESKKNLNCLSLLDSGNDPVPTLDAPISQVATANQLKSPIFKDWCDKLALPVYPNRKTWEFVYICQALKLNGMINKGKKGVGFGVGKDPMVAYFAKKGVHVLATDLDIVVAKQKGWVHTNQFSKSLKDLNEAGLVPDRTIKKYVSLKSIDMNDIPDTINGYDFTWSACALEHLGSIEKGLEFIKNSLNCIVPGGIAVHTTELNASSNNETIEKGPTVLFRIVDLLILKEDLQKDGHEVFFNFNMGDQDFDRFYDLPPYSDYTHLKLKLDRFVTTSIGIIVKKSLC